MVVLTSAALDWTVRPRTMMAPTSAPDWNCPEQEKRRIQLKALQKRWVDDIQALTIAQKILNARPFCFSSGKLIIIAPWAAHNILAKNPRMPPAKIMNHLVPWT